ncbi:hypothetical protein GWI33_002880 [Rhynchophorus ferrugineus]|uniref:Uncharacterized protein n=1 Tax=Rhynchophorus ferrugineus TaxID=354439 RepID=A0A834IMJ2_RHYFE|nr:hypothetical protein GWI33_002880 [Rhynchophorus ferrugineus]
MLSLLRQLYGVVAISFVSFRGTSERKKTTKPSTFPTMEERSRYGAAPAIFIFPHLSPDEHQEGNLAKTEVWKGARGWMTAEPLSVFLESIAKKLIGPVTVRELRMWVVDGGAREEDTGAGEGRPGDRERAEWLSFRGRHLAGRESLRMA